MPPSSPWIPTAASSATAGSSSSEMQSEPSVSLRNFSLAGRVFDLNGQIVLPVYEMYLASLINKGREVHTNGTTDPTALLAETVPELATINGAKSVLWDDEIVSIEVGKKEEVLAKAKQASAELSKRAGIKIPSRMNFL